MPTLLQLDCSADPTASRSRELTRVFADAWRRRGDGYVVRHRDLHADPLPHLESSALHWPVSDPGALGLDPEAVARQQQVIQELLAADVLLIGLPLYNYSLPSTLKAWLDRVHVPGVLAPTGAAPTQPLRGRPVVVATTRGGAYDPGTPTADWDHATPVLRIVLGEALGMDVHVVSASLTLAERVPEMAEHRERSRTEMGAARSELERLAGSLDV
ncbi:FMN-dependent NADH-azoreductase [Auraticoccus monumenti]|uniref:FMN dependent NADH:quinone oxidoreductase n=1 Tax=Auraticoccus monumenti TaxID=675864 RepID=A0A1G6V7P5_9ACTN|nr:NAD(P)H-dependent oxidoreductase [Auraticoccus monumenti]SDD48866.1 FMN-dependent NADH-azoreductase [Auraticoccus monumenti]